MEMQSAKCKMQKSKSKIRNKRSINNWEMLILSIIIATLCPYAPDASVRIFVMLRHFALCILQFDFS
jgi:hypothetical protein